MVSRRLIRYALVSIVSLGSVFGQQKYSEPAQIPDLSGLWLVQDPGSGSWADFFEYAFGPAPLTPEVQKYRDESLARQAKGDVVNRTPRTPDCPFGNLPMLMASSPPLMVVTGRGEILMASESNRARFIHTDGRDHSFVNSPDYKPSGLGHSIAHWEDETLVVDTVGFAARVCDSRFPIMRTPGGGLAKDTSHLTERWRLTENGDVLTITFEWNDPTVYTKPYRYTHTYRRVKEGVPLENNEEAPRGPGALPASTSSSQ